MSEYADILVGKLSLWGFRNYLDPGIVSLFFSKNDLVITPNCFFEEEEEELEYYTKYEYKTSVKKAKERLDALGFSIFNFEKEFTEYKEQAIDYSNYLYKLSYDYDDYEGVAAKRFDRYVTFKKWKNAINKIISYEMQYGNINSFEPNPNLFISTECEKIIYNSLKDDYHTSFYGINIQCIHIAYVFRLILDCFNDNDDIVLDFTCLQYWADDCIPKAIEATEAIEKTIILVEGTSDKDILEFSLKQIYPHLYDLFYFMDFDDNNGGKRDGGTSYVIKNLKTFYFSKLKSKFIALFDNDAEGYSSQCSLLNEIKNWPDNFRILLYPDTKLFYKYPTLVPNGSIMKDNICKKACSVELYLPDEIIMNDTGYYPIEWESRKSFKNLLDKEEFLYQGVISNKNEIKKRFHKIRKEIEKGNKSFEINEWIRMKQLIDAVVFAFEK